MILPNFICGGAPKSGTTTLYDILKNHPDIYLSAYKEPYFFNNDEYYKNGIEWYSKTFFNDYTGQKIIGDFTPNYLTTDGVPEKIESTLGKEVKFLFILRNPVDRAYSQFLHNKRDQKEPLIFEKALDEEKDRIDTYKKENNSVYVMKYGYVQQSLYADRINKYIDIFGKERVLVLIFEEVFKDIEKYISSILDFLNLNQEVTLKLDIKSNPSQVARSRIFKKILYKNSFIKRFFKKLIPSTLTRKKIRKIIQTLNNKPQEYDKLLPEVKTNMVAQYFKNDISKLENILGRDLDVWKNDIYISTK